MHWVLLILCMDVLWLASGPSVSLYLLSVFDPYQWVGPSLVAQTVKRLRERETWVQALGLEDPLEKEMATHSSTIAWKIPWTEEPGRLQSMGSQRVGHDWVTALTHSLIDASVFLYHLWYALCTYSCPIEQSCWRFQFKVTSFLQPSHIVLICNFILRQQQTKFLSTTCSLIFWISIYV